MDTEKGRDVMGVLNNGGRAHEEGEGLTTGSPHPVDASSSARTGGTRLPMSTPMSRRCSRIARRRSRV